MKKRGLVILISLMSPLATADIPFTSSASAKRAQGRRCHLIPGSLQISGGVSNLAKTKFEDFQYLIISREVTFDSGHLEPLAEGSLEFREPETLISVFNKKPNAPGIFYPARQETRFYRPTGSQIFHERDLITDTNYVILYRHISIVAGEKEEITYLAVTFEESNGNNFLFLNPTAKLRYEYIESPQLPAPHQAARSGTAVASLQCKDSN